MKGPNRTNPNILITGKIILDEVNDDYCIKLN